MSTHTRSPDPDVSRGLPLSEAGSTPTPPPHPQNVEDQSTVPVTDSRCWPAPTPSIVGKYRILQQESAGGMGIVYRAHDAELNRIVALKVIRGGVLATEEEIARFHREAKAAARLHHPHIIPVHDIGQESGCPYFTMAFAAGGSLAQQRDRFTEPRAAAALLEKIAAAIHYAHQRGIFHRDLKPGNILFDEHGNPLVSDFGLAKMIDASLDLSHAGQVLGTPAYMAPEQASGQTDRISAATDVWALGVLLYELLTGQRPFKGVSQEEQLRRVRSAEPTRPRRVKRSLDRALETVILKCLEKEPARRYASAKALAEDLARWQRGEPVQARPPSGRVRAGRAMRRYRKPALGAVLAVVLLVLLALAWRGLSPSVVPEKPSQEEPPVEMQKLLARLHEGEKVTLIGKSGPPLTSRWQGSRAGALIPLAGTEDPFRMKAGKRGGMLELLPAAPKRFRLNAQVQHWESSDLPDTPHGSAGVYFAHKEHREGEITTHGFFRLTFNDRSPVPRERAGANPVSEAGLTFALHHVQEREFLKEQSFHCEISRPFIPAGKIKPMPWRSLQVEVVPEQIKSFWEGKLIKSMRKGKGPNEAGKAADGCDPKRILLRVAHMAGDGSLFLPRGPDAEPALDGGLGLYVERGVAAFRAVEIEPLP